MQQFLYNSVVRQFEYQADNFAKSLGFKQELSSALIKINVNNLGIVDADPLYSSYYHSHPLLAERLAALDLK